jgi:hypothetical protein
MSKNWAFGFPIFSFIIMSHNVIDNLCKRFFATTNNHTFRLISRKQNVWYQWIRNRGDFCSQENVYSALEVFLLFFSFWIEKTNKGLSVCNNDFAASMIKIIFFLFLSSHPTNAKFFSSSQMEIVNLISFSLLSFIIFSYITSIS